MKNKKVIERHKPTADDWAKIRVLFLKNVSFLITSIILKI